MGGNSVVTRSKRGRKKKIYLNLQTCEAIPKAWDLLDVSLPRHPMRHGADRRQYGQHCCNIMPSWTSSVLRTGGRQSFAFERAHGRAPRRHSIGLAAASTSCATGRHRG